MKAPRILLKVTVTVLLLSLLAGCANLPDVKPFADATTLMATTLRRGFSHDEALMLRAIDATSGSDTSEKLASQLKELKKVWEPTEDALNALAAYSDALAALADAGKKGGETTQAFFNSLNGLVGAVSGLAVPANVIEVASAIGKEIAALKAEKDLRKAVNSVADIVSRKNGIADLLAQNFAELKRINAALGNAIEAHLLVSNRSIINYHNQLVEGDLRAQKILTKILEFEDIPNKLREQAQAARDLTILSKEAELKRQTLADLKAFDSGIPADLAAGDPKLIEKLENRRNQLLANSKGYRAELDRIAADFKVVDDKLKEIRELTRGGNEIFDKSQKAIKAWAKTHDDLRLALGKKHKRVTVMSILSIVSEIASALEKGEK